MNTKNNSCFLCRIFVFSNQRLVRLGLSNFLLDALATQYELGMFPLQMLYSTLEIVILVNALLKITQQNIVAQETAILLELTVVHAKRVARLL